MKTMKQSILNRMMILLCSTLLLFSSVFFSYENTIIVKAVDESDLLHDFINASLAAIGVYATGGTGATLALVLAPYISNSGFDVYNYVTQNEDGTTTISDDFTQLVLQAYKEYKEENSLKFNGEMTPDVNGYYHYDSVTSVKSGFNTYQGADFDMTITCTDINTRYPMAILVYSNRLAGNGNGIFRTMPVFYIKSEDRFYSTYALGDGDVSEEDVSHLADFGQAALGTLFASKAHFVMKYTWSGKTSSGDDYIMLLGGVTGGSTFSDGRSFEAYSSSVPVYHNMSSLMEGLRTGDFSAAYNYGTMSDFESSSYTGDYSGGDIKVATDKLNGIQDKLNEINETDKSIDDKLKDLLDWLGVGDGSGSGVTGGSWYDKILDYLDKILKQLKSIKHWTIVDTVVGGVDAIADWLDLIHDILSDVDSGAESAIATLSSALSDSMGLMKKKFPFSIPWDILFFVTVLSAEPEIPQFSIPFDFEISALDLKFHYDMELDFSEFQWLSDLSRLLLSMTYAVGLMKMTFNVSNVNKEG